MQREESIEAQKRIITKWCEINNMKIDEWFCDQAKSGKTDDRPEFQRMIEGIQAGEIGTVVVHKLDRFSRNVRDTLYYLAQFNEMGINFVSITEKIDDSPVGKLMLTILSGFNEYYVNNLSTEVMKGMMENAQKGLWTGGKAPLGYDLNKETKLLEINPREAEAVTLIFNMTSEGYGYGQIIDKLNLLGYKTKNGIPFGKNSIYEILRNERYKGIYIYNKRSASRSSDGKRNNHDFKASEDVIRIPGGCPAIVSEELWNKANATRLITGKYTNNAKHPYLLTGFMYCDKCGYAMQGNVRKLKGKIKTTYRCSARYNKRTCNCKEIKASIVDDFVLSAIFDTYFTEGAISKLTDKLNEIKQKMLSDNETLNKVREELQNDIRLRESLIDVLLETNNNPAVAERLNSTEENIRKKQEFIEQFENQIVSMFTPEDIRNSIESVKEYMKTEKNNEQIKNILSNFIDKILVGDDTIKLYLKVIPPEDKSDASSTHANKIEPEDMEITSLHISMVASRSGAGTAQYYGEGPRITKIPNFKSR